MIHPGAEDKCSHEHLGMSMLSLIDRGRLVEMGAVKFVAFIAPIYGLVFFAIFAIAKFGLEGAFAVDIPLMWISIAYGVFMAVFSWIRLGRKR